MGIENPTESQLSAIRNSPAYEFIRVQWVDLNGVLRNRILTREYVLDLLTSKSPVKVGPIVNSLGIDESLPPWLMEQPAGIDYLHFDLTSLRPCKYAPGHASVMTFIEEQQPGFERCGRTLLTRALSSAKQMGLEFLLGFEIEVTFLSRPLSGVATPGEPFARTGSSTAASLTNSPACVAALEEIMRCLQASGIPMQGFHAEWVGSQFEFPTRPKPVLEAIDNLIYTREAIKTICARHGIFATMHPKPIAKDGMENGLHTHLSFETPGKPTEQATEDAFLAGLLEQLPALCAYSMASFDSSTRVKPFFAATWVGWGTENRDFPIRKIKSRHWEIRCADATANPYLMLAAYISAGISGIERKLELMIKDCLRRAGALSEEERKEMGIVTNLPASLEEAVEALKESTVLAEQMGETITKGYVQMKEYEVEIMSKFDEEERRAIVLDKF